jgi:hypothetical protein
MSSTFSMVEANPYSSNYIEGSNNCVGSGCKVTDSHNTIITNNNQIYDNSKDTYNNQTYDNSNKATGGSVGNVSSSSNNDNTNITNSSSGSISSATTGNNTNNINTGTQEVANKVITYKKSGFDLPPAAPAIAPTVIGNVGTSTTSGAVSTPFGGVSVGVSRTTKEAKEVLRTQNEILKTQATAQDIQNLRDLEGLNPEDAKIIRDSILSKYQ